MMRRCLAWTSLVLGVALAALGGLWLLQGLGLVVLDPIACVGECTPLRGPDLGWVAAGAAVLAAGVGLTVVGWRHR